jgi:ribosomal-protein-serine acetyltransferase
MHWQIDAQTIARRLTISDASALFATVDTNRTYLRQWLPWLDKITTVQDYLPFIQECQRDYSTGIAVVLGLFRAEEFIGTISFNYIHEDSANIGYWIAEKYQQHGIITKACQRLCQYGFNKLELRKLTINCATDNLKSRALAEKLGFKLNQIIPNNEWLYDHFVDHAQYVLERHMTENLALK